MGRAGYDLTVDMNGVVAEHEEKAAKAKVKTEDDRKRAEIDKAVRNKKKLPEHATSGRVYGDPPKRDLKPLAPKASQDKK